MTPTQEALAAAYADGVRDGRDAAARESAAEIEGLRADLKEAREQAAKAEQGIDALSCELLRVCLRDGTQTGALCTALKELARWEDVARELSHLLARNQTIQFLSSPGPARLLLGHLGLQGLGMDGLLKALAVVAEECKPCPK